MKTVSFEIESEGQGKAKFYITENHESSAIGDNNFCIRNIEFDAQETTNDRTATCNWEQDNDTEWNLWETDCGESFHIEEGTPKENNMNYCCYCGKKLVEKRAKP